MNIFKEDEDMEEEKPARQKRAGGRQAKGDGQGAAKKPRRGARQPEHPALPEELVLEEGLGGEFWAPAPHPAKRARPPRASHPHPSQHVSRSLFPCDMFPVS